MSPKNKMEGNTQKMKKKKNCLVLHFRRNQMLILDPYLFFDIIFQSRMFPLMSATHHDKSACLLDSIMVGFLYIFTPLCYLVTNGIYRFLLGVDR